MPRVTVVIPVHNRRLLIGRALRSALSQDVPDLEVVVADDGSTDGTAEAVEEAAARDRRVRLVGCGERRGAQAARNAGIRAGRGEWIAFLDSDDEWLPGGLAARLSRAAANSVDVVHSECLVVDGPDAPARTFGVPPLSGAVYPELLRRPGPMFQGLLVRRSALDRIGLLDEGIVSYQEWDTSIRLARCFPFGFLPEPTFVWHFHGTDTISGDRRREAQGYEQVVIKHRDEIRRVLGRGALAEHYETAAAIHGRAGEERSRRRCLLRAIANRPFGRSLIRRIGLLLGGP